MMENLIANFAAMMIFFAIVALWLRFNIPLPRPPLPPIPDETLVIRNCVVYDVKNSSGETVVGMTKALTEKDYEAPAPTENSVAAPPAP